MNKNKHIVFLTPGFASNEADSSTIPAMQIFLKEFRNQFNGKISIISFQFPLKEKAYIWNGIEVFSLGGNNSKIKKLIIWQKAKNIFKQLNKKQSVTHIHSFWMGECAKVGAELSKKYTILHNCTLMGQDVLANNTYFKRIKNLPNLVALSKFHFGKLSQNHQLDAQIIPWGIEKTKNTLKISRSIDILGVGNLIPLKGYDRFISVVKKVQEEFPSVKAEIIGEGPEMSRLQHMIIDNNLSQNIRLIGKIERDEVLTKMSKSNCFLHLSSYESFGMVLIEAMAKGMNVFSNKVGIAEELEDIAIVENNKDAAEKIVTLLNNPKERVSKFPLLIEDTVKSYLDKVFLEESEKDIF